VDRQLIVWSTADWSVVETLSVTGAGFHEAVAFSEGTGVYLAAVRDMTVTVWNRAHPDISAVMNLPDLGSDVAIRFLPVHAHKQTSEGSILAASAGRQAVVWNLKSFTEIKPGADSHQPRPLVMASITHQGPIYALSLSPDAASLLTVSEDGTAGVWNTKGGNEVARLVHDAPIRAAAFGDAGRTVWTVDSAGVARAWDPPVILGLPYLGSRANSAATADSLPSLTNLFTATLYGTYRRTFLTDRPLVADLI
jgi:WD40 repeat protein